MNAPNGLQGLKVGTNSSNEGRDLRVKMIRWDVSRSEKLEDAVNSWLSENGGIVIHEIRSHVVTIASKQDWTVTKEDGNKQPYLPYIVEIWYSRG